MAIEPSNATGGAGGAIPGGDPNASSASSDGTENPPKPDDSKPDYVSREAYERLLDEKKRASDRLRAMEEERRRQEEQALREKEDWKKLAENKEKELEETRSRLNQLESEITAAKKVAAFNEALEGTLERKYWHLIDLDQIVVHPETGEVDEGSVAKAIKVFKAEYGELIKRPGTPSMPADAPGRGGSNRLTYEQWLALPVREREKRYKDIIEAERSNAS